MKPAEVYDAISKALNEGRSIKDAAYHLAAQINSKPAAVIKAYQRERAKRADGAHLGHGNAKFTGEEEVTIISSMLAFAQQRKAGSATLVVEVVERMDLLKRFQREGEVDQSVATLRQRAYHWAERRIQTWRKQGLIKTTTSKPANKERTDAEQQIADGTAFFEQLGAVFNAQKHVVRTNDKKKKKKKKKLTCEVAKLKCHQLRRVHPRRHRSVGSLDARRSRRQRAAAVELPVARQHQSRRARIRQRSR
jgi:hypothetical protein